MNKNLPEYDYAQACPVPSARRKLSAEEHKFVLSALRKIEKEREEYALQQKMEEWCAFFGKPYFRGKLEELEYAEKLGLDHNLEVIDQKYLCPGLFDPEACDYCDACNRHDGWTYETVREIYGK